MNENVKNFYKTHEKTLLKIKNVSFGVSVAGMGILICACIVGAVCAGGLI